ncbi:MAG: hypothetical protein ACKO81_12545, partial [Planctomycetota bacterium]
MAKRRKPSLRERLQNEKARRARENRLHNRLDYGQLEPRKLMALVWGVGDVGSNRPTGEGLDTDGFIQFKRDETIGRLTINFTIESTASIPGKRWAGSDDCQTPIGKTATFYEGSDVAYVYFKAFDDLIYERTENLRLKLEPGNGYTVDNRPQLERYLFSETTIDDNDPAIADVSVSTTDSQASEHPANSETGKLLFTRSGGELGQAL